MNTDLPALGWLSQPQMVLNEDFDWGPKDSSSVSSTGDTVGFSDKGDIRPGWAYRSVTTAGTAQLTTGVVEHVGVWTFTTAANSGDSVCLAYGQGATSGGGFQINPSATPGGIIQLDWWLNLGTATNVRVSIGLADNWQTLSGDFAIFRFDPATNANWQTITNSSVGASTTTTSTIAGATGWTKFSMVHRLQPTEAWLFYINDILAGTNAVAANLPVGLNMPGFLLRTTSAASRSILVDHCRMWVDGSLLLT